MMEGLLGEVDMKEAEFETSLTYLTDPNNEKIWPMLRKVRLQLPLPCIQTGPVPASPIEAV